METSKSIFKFLIIYILAAIYTTEEMFLEWKKVNRTTQFYELQQFEITSIKKTKFLKPVGPCKY